VVADLPRALTIITWIAVVGVTVRSILTGDYGDAWIVLGAVLIMDAVRSFGEFAAGKGFFKIKSDEMVALLAAGWLVGVLLLWALAKAIIPRQIAGDFRIMGIVILAFMLVSLINWMCKFRLSPRQDQRDKK